MFAAVERERVSLSLVLGGKVLREHPHFISAILTGGIAVRVAGSTHCAESKTVVRTVKRASCVCRGPKFGLFGLCKIQKNCVRSPNCIVGAYWRGSAI